MPLAKSSPRKMLHLRDIQLRGYAREDGLFDIEAHFTDVRTYAGGGGNFGAGEPIHDMWLRVTVDPELVIQDCQAAMDTTPHEICSLAAPNVQRLQGLKIGKGFIKAAMQRVGGVEGCTHLRELLQPIATVAFQTLMFRRPQSAPGKNWVFNDLINSCYALREDGPVVVQARAQAAAQPIG